MATRAVASGLIAAAKVSTHNALIKSAARPAKSTRLVAQSALITDPTRLGVDAALSGELDDQIELQADSLSVADA